MTVIQKTIGRLPVNIGDYDSTRAYGKKNRVLLYGCEWESKVDNNTYAPAALNTTTGVITPDTTHWKLISGSYNTWLIDNGYQKMDATNVKDGNNNQHQINASFANEIGSDSTPESIKGRITNLEEAVGSGGSVDERIAEEGARHYLKSETYTKSEVNGMITTPDQEYVTVTATDQTTAVTDVLPATGEPDTVYRVGNWDGNQYDATAYSEYAWNESTSQYIHLSTKPQIGEVFDISAYHATGGTLATYSDLNDALNGVNGGVPQSLQKGGMSVKFVQSSDNKYVQARCMAQNFTTDVTQWQGVDSEIFAESDNFANIGLIAKYCKKIQSQRATGIFVKGYYITTNVSVIDNTPVANSGFCYSIIEVEEGDICCIKGQGGGGPRLYAVTDSNLNVLKLADASPVVEEKEITIDVGGKYLFVNSLINVEHFAYIKRREVKQTSGDSKIDLMSQDAITNLVYTMQGVMANFRFVNGKRIVNNTAPVSGSMVDNSSYCCAVVDVTEDETYNIKGRGGSTSRLYSIVDNEGNILDMADLNTTSGILIELNVTIPANAVKMYVNSEINCEHHLYKKYPVARQGFGNSKIDYISQRASSDLIQFNSVNKRVFEYIDDYFVNVSGTTIPTSPSYNTSYSYAKSKVLPGERIVVRGQGGGGPRLYAISDKNDNIIKVAGTAINTSVSTQEIVVPMNGAWIYVNSLKAVEHYAYAEAPNDRLIKTDSVVYLAASNSSDFDKAMADYVCTGSHDEKVINKAIDDLVYGGKIVFLLGDYIIDEFTDWRQQGFTSIFPSAIYFKNNENKRYIIFEGVRSTWPMTTKASRIIVSDTCYNALDNNTRVAIFTSGTDITGSFYHNAFAMKDLQFELPNCTKPVICVSCRNTVYQDIEGVICYNRRTRDQIYNREEGRSPLPNILSCGFYGTAANNSWYYMRFWECCVQGFGVAYNVGGDHITMINCASSRNIYGYAFGFEELLACAHHITLINCCSETDARFMVFGEYTQGVKEPVVVSNFQIEYDDERAVEFEHKLCETLAPDNWVGEVSYSAMRMCRFFEDGNGKWFRTVGLRNRRNGTTAQRPTTQNYLEEYYDETIGKKIFWNGSNWIDAMGNVV